MIPLFFRRRPQRQENKREKIVTKITQPTGCVALALLFLRGAPCPDTRPPGLRRRIAVDFPRNQRVAYPCTQRTAGHMVHGRPYGYYEV